MCMTTSPVCSLTRSSPVIKSRTPLAFFFVLNGRSPLPVPVVFNSPPLNVRSAFCVSLLEP